LRLIDKGVTREESYKMVQSAAMKVWEDTSKNLEEELISSPEIIKYLDEDEIKDIFKSKKMLQNVDYIFSRSVDKD
jgi:adenylosuccinate lyase